MKHKENLTLHLTLHHAPLQLIVSNVSKDILLIFVLLMIIFVSYFSGNRLNADKTDLSEILPEEVEEEAKAAAEISMGTEV